MAVVGGRWHIKHAFEVAEQETGLDDYEVRSRRRDSPEGSRCPPGPGIAFLEGREYSHTDSTRPHHVPAVTHATWCTGRN